MIAPTVGGDKMDETLERKTNEFLAEHGCEYKVVKGYGMTEVNAAVAACSNNEINKIGTVGLPFAKETIAIFKPDTEEEVLLGEIGEVCITGPNTMLGYYNNEEATHNVLKTHADGKTWMHSGDIGYFDKDGQLYILDRIKRIVIRYDGFKIFPSVIENVISSVDGVKNCSVIGVPDKEHAQGKLPYAYVNLNENVSDENEILAKITEKCESELPEYSQLCGIKVVDSIPYTGIGKVNFRALEEEYEAKTLELKK
jgi:long-chain acyl-CoA synthetase